MGNVGAQLDDARRKPSQVGAGAGGGAESDAEPYVDTIDTGICHGGFEMGASRGFLSDDFEVDEGL